MANPSIVKDVLEIAEKAISTVGETVKHNKKEEEETKRVAATENNKTDREAITANKENRDSEINATVDTVNHSTDNTTEMAKHTTIGALDKLGDATEKVAEAGTKSVEYIKDMADVGAKKLLETQEHNQKQLEAKDKAYKDEIEKVQNKIEEYQGMLQQASIEITKYRTTQEVQSQFTQNILTFAEAEATHRQKISDTKNTLSRVKRKLEPLLTDIQEIETNIAVVDSHYEKLHDEFNKKIYSLELLKFEYKESIEEAKYRETLARQERELKRLLDEIEQKELELCNREYERLVKKEEMEPLLLELEKSEIALEYLEAEHNKLIVIGTHSLANMEPAALENKNKDTNIEFIDIEINEIESDKHLEKR